MDFDTIIRSSGLRLTVARRSILELLSASFDPISASEIFEALAAQNHEVDLVTVYRTVDALERAGLIIRADRVKQGWRYTARWQHHGHVITCSGCGCSSHTRSCELGKLESRLEKTTGYTNICHSLQFFGICPNCRHQQSAG